MFAADMRVLLIRHCIFFQLLWTILEILLGVQVEKYNTLMSDIVITS